MAQLIETSGDLTSKVQTAWLHRAIYAFIFGIGKSGFIQEDHLSRVMGKLAFCIYDDICIWKVGSDVQSEGHFINFTKVF